MAKDDFYVIVYRILNYLYNNFKKGILADCNKLSADALSINDKYFNDILIELYENGYIKGIEYLNNEEQNYIKIKMLKDVSITMKGIDYLTSSEFISKAKKFYMGTINSVPYIDGI